MFVIVDGGIFEGVDGQTLNIVGIQILTTISSKLSMGRYHIGLATGDSNSTYHQIGLNDTHDTAALLTKLSNFTFESIDNIPATLEKVRMQMLNSSREGYPKIGLLLTDGFTNVDQTALMKGWCTM